SDYSGCRADLAQGADAGVGWAQVWDLPPITLEKVHYLLPQRRCGCCRKITTAVPPFGAAGNVMYGPHVNAAAILLASEGSVPLERTAMLMASLLGTPVSTGFVVRALERFAQHLGAAGFDEAMTTALRPRRTGTRIPARGHGAHPRRTAGLVRPRSAPNPRPPSWAWTYWRATPATWSATSTPADTNSTPNSPASSNAQLTSSGP
ncbi:MAG: hypothetical protein ACRDRU_15110, partial [Pseudonocardiaceae bacterium]